MACTRNEIVAQAGKWIGYCESNGSHKQIIDIYNAHKPLAQNYRVKYTDAWCATFASACAIKCGATDIIPTECGCERMINLFKNLGCWVEDDNYVPSAGDFIFYDWDDSGSGDCTGWTEHVGIVSNVSNGYMTVIEGNYSNSVGSRSIKCGARYIRGYGVPKYTESSSSSSSSKKSIAQVAKEVIQGLWGNGSDRIKKLTSAGYDANEVQNAVNDTLTGNKGTSKSVETLAREVLMGKWGNGSERKKLLEAAGYSYSKVQQKVNELLRK